ncbi:hypothetical protein J6S88_03120 [bacterium]|nr:hypothetical protein [bacterium]
MLKAHDFTDGETVRRQRNLTQNQKKINVNTQEGVLINNYYKPDFTEISDTLIISNKTSLPDSLNDKKQPKDKNLIALSALSLGIMSTIAGFTWFLKKNTKNLAESDANKILPTLTRNVAINDETHQAIYRMVHNPNRQTILAGSGVLALTVTTFMAKTFLDGLKDVWVKKREADIQKNLQENLIAVETQTFSGKMQIIRNMLGVYTEKFKQDLTETNTRPNFGSKNSETNSLKGNDNVKYLVLGLTTFVGILALSYLSIKNLSKGKKYLDENTEAIKRAVDNVIQSSTTETMERDKELLKNMFSALGTSKNYIKSKLKNLNWAKEKIAEFENELTKSTAKVEKAIGGDGSDKPTFYSHVDDYRAHLYNYLLDTDNKQFKQLFFGIFGITALGYTGKLTGEAIKEVEVKKINAETELDLQRRLVSTELRNFKNKKDAAITPLIEEFDRQKSLSKPKEELKVMADNILFEIKNGAPFVYS